MSSNKIRNHPVFFSKNLFFAKPLLSDLIYYQIHSFIQSSFADSNKFGLILMEVMNLRTSTEPCFFVKIEETRAI